MPLSLTMKDEPVHRAAYNRAHDARMALEGAIRRGAVDAYQWLEYEALVRLAEAEADLAAIQRNRAKAAA